MNKNPLENIADKHIIILHKGDAVITDEMDTFSELDLSNRDELAETLAKIYKIEEFPCILAYGDVYSISDMEAVKKREAEFSKKELETAIETIKKNKRVIFIKGTPAKPECKFTREFVSLLKEEGLTDENYTSINILESPAVREGIKEYGDWPTYPQLYVEGELVGGLDVIKAERARGNIKKCLGLKD
ncbi:hypothetical protein NEMIN01_1090 [Nematocida minor]|uniref:uncharacterized protein n=1 Tax=Nematocida minor TaxID=1912983 RepID=UPI002220104D|nr:uncharacterized protein NEMIN01_1090 [Nematocida minor]KAI5190552.1 hypothetical protein NEMIN01_1090 [Nematocida minor]